MAAAEAIFYMTGTGNSYQVAMCWAALSGGSVPRQLTAERWQPATTAAERLVFCYPTHGFTAPWLIWQRLWELPAGQGQAAVLLPTRAGTRCLGRSFPGMEGTAGYLPALLLAFKGYRVQVVAALDMPSNWTALHWGLSADNAAVLRTAAQQKIQIIWQAVADGRRYWRGWLPFTLGIALLGGQLAICCSGSYWPLNCSLPVKNVQPAVYALHFVRNRPSGSAVNRRALTGNIIATVAWPV